MDIDNEDVFGGQRNPMPQSLLQPQVPLQLPPPPQPQSPSRRDLAQIIGWRWYSNSPRPSNAGQSDNKYCSTGHHHWPSINFTENGQTYYTCNDCQEFRLFKPFRLSLFRTQDSFHTNTHSRHDITQIS